MDSGAYSLRRTALARAAATILALLEPTVAATQSPHSAVDPVVSRGLKETNTDRKIAENAARMVNRLIESATYRLQVSWKTAEVQTEGLESIPLYLVGAPRKATSTPAAVPLDCRCVFVNPLSLRGWLKAHSNGTGRLDLDPAGVLAFMLLHEMGHIEARTSAVEFINGGISQFNVSPSVAKAKEEAADDFAAALIRKRSGEQPISDASLTANQIASELLNLTWNMQAYRTLDEFASWTTGEPRVYLDPGYSHPNLAWRILRSNYIIHQSESAKELLDAFEEARARGADPQPLYQAK